MLFFPFSTISFSPSWRIHNPSFQYDISSRTYHASFSTGKAKSNFTVSEFAIKRDEDNAFARNVFSTGYNISAGQYINFEYKLTLGWGSTIISSLPFTGTDPAYTYTVPITSTTYNIPYNRVYYANNYLLLIDQVFDQDNSSLPINVALPLMGDTTYATSFKYAINGSSIYTPATSLTSIDHTNRIFSVTSLYTNIACAKNSGVHNTINTALIVKDGNMHIPSNKFNVTRFAYPLTVYSESTKCIKDHAFQYNAALRYNIISLAYNYTWGE